MQNWAGSYQKKRVRRDRLMENILITTSTFGNADDSVFLALTQRGYHVNLNPYGRTLTEKELIELLNCYMPVGMIAGVDPITISVLNSCKKLKVISRCGIGLDNIELDAARKQNIKVFVTPDAPSDAVAELTIGLILAFLRSIVESDTAIKNGLWEKKMGCLLRYKTIGIVGCGRVGARVAHLLSSFGARIIGFDPYSLNEKFIELMDFSALISMSDIITLHIPYNNDTHHLINRKTLSLIKKGALLVNTSRGGIIDEQALFEAIISGHISGACLDTFEKEPYVGPLTGLKQVILTPHIGSYAREARIRMEREAVDNLLKGLEML